VQFRCACWDNSLDRRQNVAQSVSQVLFCFPTLGVHVLSPYRDGRCCSASEPGKEKQKSYNYCSAVLMVHRVSILPFWVHPGTAQKPARGYTENGCSV